MNAVDPLSYALDKGWKSSPISRLHDELLSLIFETLVADCEGEIMPSLNLARFLLVVTLVCRKWNDIAIHTPRFWRNIVHAAWPRSIPFYSMKACVRNSRAVSLNVAATGKEIEDIYDHLKSVGALARVRSLCFDDAGSDYLLSEPTALFLRSTVHNIESMGLVLRTSDVGECFALLKLSGCLRDLNITLHSPATFFRRTPQSNDIIPLPDLQSFRIIWTDRTSMLNFISVLSARNLQELVLVAEREDRETHEAASKPVQGSFDRLQRLTFGGELSTADMRSVLCRTPQLEDLRLFGIPGVNMMGALFDVVPDYPLPHLKRVSFYGDPPDLHMVHQMLNGSLGSNVKAVAFSERIIKGFSAEKLDQLANRVAILRWKAPYLHYTFRRPPEEVTPVTTRDGDA